MSKSLKSKSDVIEWYWPDYLDYCLRSRKTGDFVRWQSPTLDGFWKWYITDGPLGVKTAGRFYSKTEIEYV